MSAWIRVEGKRPDGLADDDRVFVKFFGGTEATISEVVEQIYWQDDGPGCRMGCVEFYRLAQPPSNAAQVNAGSQEESVAQPDRRPAANVPDAITPADPAPLNPAQRLLSAMGLRHRLYNCEPVARAAKGELPISAFNEWRKL